MVEATRSPQTPKMKGTFFVLVTYIQMSDLTI